MINIPRFAFSARRHVRYPLVLAGLLLCSLAVSAQDKSVAGAGEQTVQIVPVSAADSPERTAEGISRTTALVGSLTVFLLSIVVGVEVITKVPPTLHTPLMSGSNAISGITIVGAILAAGHATGGFGTFLGLLAVILAMINVVGGFLVTHRMLMMFKKR